MSFPIVSKQEIIQKLEKVGVEKGDIIYVASFMPIMGNSPTILDDTNNALIEAVGDQGTVIMPVFNWDYCHGSIFDPLETVSQVGILTENFRRRRGVLRNISPPWCTYAAAGKKAGEIAEINGTSAFGSDGVSQYLLDENVRYVLIGCNYNDSVIHVHWLEEKFEVPYRYWKQFKGKVRINSEIINNVSYMYARRLDVDTRIDSHRLTSEFEKTGKVKIEKIGLGELRSFRAKDYVEFIAPYFENDRLAVLLPEVRKYFE